MDMKWMEMTGSDDGNYDDKDNDEESNGITS